jgi:hypothetical protein
MTAIVLVRSTGLPLEQMQQQHTHVSCRLSTSSFMGSPRFEGFEAGGVVREGSGLPATEEEEGMLNGVSARLSVHANSSPSRCHIHNAVQCHADRMLYAGPDPQHAAVIRHPDTAAAA